MARGPAFTVLFAACDDCSNLKPLSVADEQRLTAWCGVCGMWTEVSTHVSCGLGIKDPTHHRSAKQTSKAGVPSVVSLLLLLLPGWLRCCSARRRAELQNIRRRLDPILNQIGLRPVRPAWPGRRPMRVAPSDFVQLSQHKHRWRPPAPLHARGG